MFHHLKVITSLKLPSILDKERAEYQSSGLDIRPLLLAQDEIYQILQYDLVDLDLVRKTKEC